jgi:uncharacterized cupredoxin-like copper-binding protein
VRQRHLLLLGTAMVLLAGASTVGLATASGAFRGGSLAPDGQCSAPALSGTVVDVTLTNMGGAMMGGAMMGGSMMGGPMMGGMMGILLSTDRAPAGTVSFRVAITGGLVHELVVLPLPDGQSVGARAVHSDGRVDEVGSLGEASRTCGAGTGGGIDSGAIGWVTLNLSAGNYELVCNFPWHYAAGMHAGLTVP